MRVTLSYLFIVTLLSRLYVKVCILLVCGKYLHHRSFHDEGIGNVWVQISNLLLRCM